MALTFKILLFTVLVANILCHTKGGCDYFNPGPIQLAKGNVVATDVVTIEEQMELWFEIQLEPGWHCETGFCMLIHIGIPEKGKPRFPLINLITGDTLKVSFTDHGGYAFYPWTIDSFFQYEITDPRLTSTINDGNVHKIYALFTPRKRVFIYDDLVLYNITTPGGIQVFAYNAYYNYQYDVVVVRSTSSPLVPANMTNLCINSTTHPTMDPTTDPTNIPTMEPTTNKPTSDTLFPTINPTIYPTLEPTINPTINPTNYPTKPSVAPTLHPTHDDVNVNQEPTMEPTLEPTPKSIIKFVELDSATMTETEKAFLFTGICLLCIAILCGGIYCYRTKQKLEKQMKNTIDILKTSQSAETAEIEMEPPIAFTVPYNEKREEVEGEDPGKNDKEDNEDNNDTDGNDTDHNDADHNDTIFDTKGDELCSSLSEINQTTLPLDDGEC